MADVANSPKITASIKFPATLWDMIHKCKSGAISWGRFGNCVKIKKCAFEKEYLTSGEKFSSFIRQLNLYGFRKLHQVKYVGMPAELYNDVVEYQHRLFVKGHPELLLYIRRKVSKRKDTPKTVSIDCTAQTSSEVSENADQQETHSDKSKRIHDEKVSIVDINSSSSQQLSKTRINEIFQVVSQTLSEEVMAFGGAARISGPVFPSFNLASPKRISAPK